uniref:DNA-repair protein Xrcc1 N-terminal domain-containing protein n=1 Tax=Knipowitschia caucasica TaxID=637954 RepID=A0AAV2M9N4_KNICA
MPLIKLQHVVSCSTEDTTHKAENLLSSDTYRKWKAARAGEKQTSVILQFEKEEQVHSIDIGNEGSAFIEVLVANSSAARDQDYEVMLINCTTVGKREQRLLSELYEDKALAGNYAYYSKIKGTHQTGSIM